MGDISTERQQERYLQMKCTTEQSRIRQGQSPKCICKAARQERIFGIVGGVRGLCPPMREGNEAKLGN